MQASEFLSEKNMASISKLALAHVGYHKTEPRMRGNSWRCLDFWLGYAMHFKTRTTGLRSGHEKL